MIEIGNFVQISPEYILIFLTGLILFSIISSFVVIPIIKSQKIRDSFSYQYKIIKRNAPLTIILVGILLIALGGSYLWYLSTRPQVISSDKFRRVESENLKFIEDYQIYSIVTEGNLLLFDVRSEEEFLKEHISNSLNAPIEDIENNRSLRFVTDRKIAFYSSNNDFESAKEAAFYVFDNFEAKKIYIINDGYESLSSTGFTLYS